MSSATKTAPSRTTAGIWTPVQQALVEGSPLSTLRVTDPNEADTIAVALKTACARRRWLLPLLAADSHRLLSAVGITLAGAARDRWDARQKAEGWGAQPSEFERAAAAPQRLVTPRLSGQLSIGASIDTSTKPVTATGVSSWPLATPVQRLQALAQSAVAASTSSSTQSQPQTVIPTHEEGYSHSADVNYVGITLPWDVVMQVHESL
jgi:hypothetical protein